MKYPLRIAVLGCGGMGSGHVLAITGKEEERPDFLSYNVYTDGQIAISSLKGKLELAGVYDIDDKRMQWVAENGWHCYKDYADMLADPDLDIVLIATPNNLHREEAISALRAGKHVLCEKPVMMNSQELEEVMAVARETGLVFYPRQNRRWDYDYLVAKKIFDEGLLGKVFNVESRVMGSRGIPGDWRKEKAKGGGMMLDWGVHLLDRLVQMIPGKISSVYCKCSYVTGEECDDGFKAFLNFANGITAEVEVGTCQFIDHPNWYMAGLEGTARIDNFAGDGKMVRVTKWHEDNIVPIQAGEGLTKTMAPRDAESTEVIALPPVVVDRNGLYINLVAVITQGAEPLVTAEEAMRVLKLMEKLFEADEKNMVLPFEN